MSRSRKAIVADVRSAMERQVQAAEEVIADALAYAGCPEPKVMAAYFLAAQANGGNGDEAQTIRALLGHEDTVASSTATNRIKCIDWRRFQEYLNEVFVKETQGDLQRRPPDDGRTHMPVDPHFENYKPRRAKADEAFNAVAKAYYAVYNPKQNKRSPKAIAYLAISIAWLHQNKWVSRVLHVELLTPLQVNDSAHHCRIIDKVAKRLGRRVETVLLDAWYDSAQVRNLLSRAGYEVVHRMRFGERGKNVIWIDGQRHRLQDLAKSLADDPYAFSRHVERWGPEGRPTRFPVKQKILTGHLGATAPKKRPRGENRPSQVQIQVAFTNDGSPRRIDWTRSSAIALHGPTTRRRPFLYHVRWTIETLFQVLENTRPSHKEQLITREVVNFLTLILLNTTMAHLRRALADRFPGHRIRDRRIADVALRTWINGVLIGHYFA